MNRLLDIDRVLDDWLALGPEELPDLVLDRVAGEIDGISQERAGLSLGGVSINRFALAGTIAAAIVVLIIGLGILSGRNVGDPEPTPTPAPMSLVGTDDVVLVPGRYEVDAPFPVRVSFDVPPAWETYAEIDQHLAAVCKGETCELGLAFWVIDNLPVDPCQPTLGDLDPPVGPTVDDLATALVAQPGYETAGPTDAAMSGFAGAYVELVGQGLPAGGCYERTTWTIGPHWRRSLHEEADQLWILDVDGTRLLVNAFAMSSAIEADRAELRDMVESIRIEAP